MKICGQSPIAKKLRKRWWCRKYCTPYPPYAWGHRVRFTHYTNLWCARVEIENDKGGWIEIAHLMVHSTRDSEMADLCRWLHSL